MPPDRSIPGKEVEIHILPKEDGAGNLESLPGRVYVRVNGGGLVFSHECTIPLRKIRKQYQGLENQRDKTRRVFEWHEHKFGLDLGAALFEGSSPTDHPTRLSRALRDCVDTLEAGEYVRLLLYCERSPHEQLPWELTYWPEGLLWLGRDPRVAFTRLARGSGARRRERLSGGNDAISILSVLSEKKSVGSRSGFSNSPAGLLARDTRAALETMEDMHPRLHFVARDTSYLDNLHRARNLSGTSLDHNVVQWLGHSGVYRGRKPTMLANMAVGGATSLTVDQVYEWTGNAFLYVMLSCNAFGEPTGVHAEDSSIARELIQAGAAAVLGSYSLYAPGLSEPLLTPLYLAIAAGFPLDFTMQYLRRAIHEKNLRRHRLSVPRNWSQLALMVGSNWYLGGGDIRNPYRLLTLPIKSFTQTLEVWDRILEDILGSWGSGPPIRKLEDGEHPRWVAESSVLMADLERIRRAPQLKADPRVSALLNSELANIGRREPVDVTPEKMAARALTAGPGPELESASDEIELTEEQVDALASLQTRLETLSLVRGLM